MLALAFVVATVVPTVVPYEVVNIGTINITTPAGQVISIPERSVFSTNFVEIRLDSKTIELNNSAIFSDGFEQEE
jgi:hypothetical protein